MSTMEVPASAGEALGMLAAAMKVQQAALSFLADMDAASTPVPVLAECLQALERTDAVEAAARGRLLAAFDAQDGSLTDGQPTTRAWLVNVTRVTKGQAAEYRGLQDLSERHRPLHAGLAEGDLITKSVALQLGKWTGRIPDGYRAQAEEIVISAARAGADLRALAAIIAEIVARTAPPDPEDGPEVDRRVFLDTTLDGAGVLRGDLTPECAAMVQAVLDALSAPQAGGDLRTGPERCHDALEEAMRRLLASGLLPKRAGQPVKALVHMSFVELCELDTDSALQDKWIADYRARWAAHRAEASVGTGDGGAWLEGEAARRIGCDAMLIPVVTADIDPGAVEALISICVRYHALRTQNTPATPDSRATPDRPDGPDGPGTPDGSQAPGPPGGAPDALVFLEQQILATVLQVVSGPGGVASFLRRNLLGRGLNGPSLPLDVGQP
jgi:hypothetical protein